MGCCFAAQWDSTPQLLGSKLHSEGMSNLGCNTFGHQTTQCLSDGNQLTPPSFLRSKITVTPKKTCLTDSGRSPCKIKLVNSARARSKSLPPRSAEADVRSTRCCGRIPFGPPADPRGNDRIAPVITSSDITGRGCMSSGCGGIWDARLGMWSWMLFLQQCDGLLHDVSNALFRARNSNSTLVITILKLCRDPLS